MTPEEIIDYNKLYKHWIDNINIIGEGLTKWESDFMESITTQVTRGTLFDGLILSPKQSEIVQRIYEQRT